MVTIKAKKANGMNTTVVKPTSNTVDAKPKEVITTAIQNAHHTQRNIKKKLFQGIYMHIWKVNSKGNRHGTMRQKTSEIGPHNPNKKLIGNTDQIVCTRGLT